jgi:hypothetical protein
MQARASWRKEKSRPEDRKAPGIEMTAGPAVAFSKLKIVAFTPPGCVSDSMMATTLNCGEPRLRTRGT